MSEYTEYGEVLRIVRIACDMKMREVTQSKVISKAYLSEIELGKKRISPKKLKALLEFYGISLEDFTSLYKYYKRLRNVDAIKRYQRTLLKALELYIR